MRWYEKLDIVLFTYNLPLTAIFAFFIFMNLTIAPVFRLNLGAVYALWMLVPTVIFFFSPMLNDFIMWAFRLNPLRTVIYTVSVVMLYGSMLTTSLISATMGIFGKKARFIVTPKSSQKMTLKFAFKYQWRELLFATVLLLVSLLFQRTILPVILIVLTGYSSFALLFFSNIRYSPSETERIDEETMRISLATNKLFSYNQEREEKRLATKRVKKALQ